MTRPSPPRRERSKHELRCFCRGEPLLAVYGTETSGELYVHVKIHKQGRVYGETYHTGGTVKIKCRNCMRWNRVKILAPNAAQLEVTEPPVAAERA
jgi:hypothetical protein